MNKEVQNFLLDIGMSASLSGFAYITYAEELIMEDPTRIQHITKWLYPDVAKHFKTTASSVERGIRHAITTTCNKGNSDYIGDLFRYSVSSNTGVPTNSQFLARTYYHFTT